MLFTDEWHQEERTIDLLHGGIRSFQPKKIQVERRHKVYFFYSFNQTSYIIQVYIDTSLGFIYLYFNQLSYCLLFQVICQYLCFKHICMFYFIFKIPTNLKSYKVDKKCCLTVLLHKCFFIILSLNFCPIHDV